MEPTRIPQLSAEPTGRRREKVGQRSAEFVRSILRMATIAWCVTRMMAAQAALERVGLGDMARRQIQALSAGQFQRVLFARTILQDASLILLDEPFTAVDAATTRLLLSVIQEWHAQGRTVIAVLHDMDVVRRFFPRTLTLSDDAAEWSVQPDAGRQAA